MILQPPCNAMDLDLTLQQQAFGGFKIQTIVASFEFLCSQDVQFKKKNSEGSKNHPKPQLLQRSFTSSICNSHLEYVAFNTSDIFLVVISFWKLHIKMYTDFSQKVLFNNIYIICIFFTLLPRVKLYYVLTLLSEIKKVELNMHRLNLFKNSHLGI